MNNFFIFVFSIILIQSALAERVDINKVLFSVAGTTWTSRDFQVYQSVLNEVYKKKKLTDYSQSEINDFMLSRLSDREAKVFDLAYEKVSVNEGQRKKIGFTNAEIDREVQIIAKSVALIEIKESYHKDSARFNTWFDLMKRKYVVKVKSFDVRDLK